MSKRPRSSIGRYDDSSDERMTPEKDRRSRGRSPGSSPSRSRYPPEPSHRDDYGRGRERPYSGYKVLCVSALHQKASDDVIRDTLYREFKKYGEISVKVVHEPDERVAYVYFRSYEDARDAKHSKSRIILFDKPVIVEAAYESQSVGRSTSDIYTSRRPRSITPEYDRYSYRSRSPGLDRHRPDDRYGSYGPPPPIPPHREFRREGPMHHDFLPRGPPHHPPGGGPHSFGGPRGYKNFEKIENKRDKFPNYLHHVPPEDDPLATRTLFAGNLEINISDEELRRIFSRYGLVEDIDIKRPPPGTGNAYAFVRYQNLDQAHRAKVELSGQYIGKFQCKIGYGKVTPTTRIWVGGLGPWTSLQQLEREFDRFGAIKKIEYNKGDSQAHILYDSIDAAQAAVKEMRGYPLGGPDRRLRADFSDVSPSFPYKSRGYDEATAATGAAGGEYRHQRDDYGGASGGYERPGYENWNEDYAYSGGGGGGGGYRGRGGWSDRRGGGRGGGRFRPGYEGHEEWSGKRGAEGDGDGAPPRQLRRTSRTPEPGEDRSHSPRRRSAESDNASDKFEGRRNGVLSSARNLTEITRKSEASWQGALILKNSLFPSKLHLTDGDVDVIETLLKDEEGKPHLRITQRLRLDPSKLEDVSKRITSSTQHAIFLAVPGSASAVTLDDNNVQSRPLRNLVSYLKQKEAAGVISLQNKEQDSTGVLYAFPPCQFSGELLRRTAANLTEESLKEDHLVIVVVKGSAT